MEQIYIEIYLKWIYYIWDNVSHFLFHCWYCFIDIYLNGCNNGGNSNHEDGVWWWVRYLFCSCQRRWRAPVLLLLLLFVFWFGFFVPLGVAAATLLAEDEPIKRSFQTEQMCTLWLTDALLHLINKGTILIWCINIIDQTIFYGVWT